MRKTTMALAYGIIALGLVSSNGCFWVLSQGPALGVFSIPIPVSPYVAKVREDDFWEHERYERVPILGPITAGGPAAALDEPSDDQIIRALERSHPVQGGIPFIYETQRNNVLIQKDLIADYVDPPRFYPLIGPAQLHHAHYKCTVYFSERMRVGWPIPHTNEDEDSVEVIYIDHNHLHMVGNVDTGIGSNY